jgi:hypothetical protein
MKIAAAASKTMLLLLGTAAGVRAQGDGPVIVDEGCAGLDAAAVARILGGPLGARGEPWRHLEAKIQCDATSVRVGLLDRSRGDNFTQSLFVDWDGMAVASRAPWLADVIVELAAETWGFEVNPGGAALTVAPGAAATTPHRPPGGASAPPGVLVTRARRSRAPSLAELAGPVAIAGRASFRVMHVEDEVLVPSFGLYLSRAQGRSWGLLLGVTLASGEKDIAGGSVETFLVELTGGGTWRLPLSPAWSFETDLGVSAVNARLTRRLTLDPNATLEDTGWGMALALTPMVFGRLGRARAGLGPTVGWNLFLPESNPEDGAAVSVGGLFVGAVLHLGSVPAGP